MEKKISSSEKEFKNRIKDIENRFEIEQKQNETLRDKIKKLETENENESEQLKCETCDFTTTSKKGLKLIRRGIIPK